MPPSTVVDLDNGGGLIKAGRGGGEMDLTTIIPNCLYRPLSFKKWLRPSTIAATTTTTTTSSSSISDPIDLTSFAVRHPIDRGYVISPDLQGDIWAHLPFPLRPPPDRAPLLPPFHPARHRRARLRGLGLRRPLRRRLAFLDPPLRRQPPADGPRLQGSMQHRRRLRLLLHSRCPGFPKLYA